MVEDGRVLSRANLLLCEGLGKKKPAGNGGRGCGSGVASRPASRRWERLEPNRTERDACERRRDRDGFGTSAAVRGRQALGVIGCACWNLQQGRQESAKSHILSPGADDWLRSPPYRMGVSRSRVFSEDAETAAQLFSCPSRIGARNDRGARECL